MNTQTILGIDPGYDRVGWCVLSTKGSMKTLVKSGCIQTQKTQSFTQRYQHIQTSLESILKEYHPTICALENLFFQNNAKTAMHVSEARGIILGILIQHTIPITEYTPLQIKSALTGNGRATKQEVARMIRLLTITKKLPKLDDEVDAIAIALCQSYTLQL